MLELFQNFFQYGLGSKFCNKVGVKRPTTSKSHCYTTFWCIVNHMFQVVFVFSAINISIGSVTTCLRCGGIFYYRFSWHLLLNLAAKEFWNTWFGFVLVCRISFGQLRNRSDEQQPSDNCSSLQELVQGLCSVQRLIGCWRQRHRHLLTVLWEISLRHSSRLSHLKSRPLPHRSFRIRKMYVTIITFMFV